MAAFTSPSCGTDETELMSANLAGNVITPMGSLVVHLALWALFGHSRQQLQCRSLLFGFHLTADLILVLVACLARVPGNAAPDALEVVTASALKNRVFRCEVDLAGFAVKCKTPEEIWLRGEVGELLAFFKPRPLVYCSQIFDFVAVEDLGTFSAGNVVRDVFVESRCDPCLQAAYASIDAMCAAAGNASWKLK
jgi:hypothetical protein